MAIVVVSFTPCSGRASTASAMKPVNQVMTRRAVPTRQRGTFVDIVLALTAFVSGKTFAEVMTIKVVASSTVTTRRGGAVINFNFTEGAFKPWSTLAPVNQALVFTCTSMMADVMESNTSLSGDALAR